ncbi:MAG TPA: Hpt domain-containing protein, partial [Bdellovibrio sp.]|uniref:chemotaxis protein CheA n=1 Tax=Bdellovibrio sp. TaxID=28201 RepID=UPI002F174901
MSGDNSFFEELQMDFLNESAFMLEQFEESMIKLETSEEPAKDLTDIFRVAHSVKGGAAAVGLMDLAKFAHVMEDLLDLLRSRPELVNPNAISLLLKSGDELKNRISSLQKGQGGPWDTSELVAQLIEITESLSGKPSKRGGACAPATAHADDEVKEQAPDDFFATPSAETSAPEEDHTNHDLLAELLAQLSPEDQAEFQAKEEAEAAAKKSATPAPVPTPVLEEPVMSAPAAQAAPAPAPATPKAVPAAEKPALKAVPKENPQQPPAAAGGNGGANKAAAKNAVSSIKVDTGRVDSVLDAVGELVVLKNQLVHDETVRSGVNLRLEAIVDQLDKAVRELYEKTLSIRMTPLKSMFIKIQRIVRDVSLTLDKPVDLQLIGEETEVERTVFELLGDPLVHLVRNSMDHGIEKKEIRQERGKPATAKVTVSAKQNGGNVTIEIIDDGGGINR